MRHSLLLLLALVVVSTGCETRSAKAVRYNDAILNQQAQISLAFNAMDSALNTFDGREMEYAQKLLQAEVMKGQKLLDTIGTFRGDSSLLVASRSLFNFYETVAEDDYAELMHILSIPDSSYTRDHQTRAYELDSVIRVEFKVAHDAFVRKQQKFWNQYHIVASEE